MYQFATIFVSYRQVDGLNFTGAYDMLTMVIADLYNKHLYLLDGIRQKVVPSIEKKGFAAVSSSFFAALCSAFGRYDVVHIHAEGPAFFCWIPKLFGKRVISTIHGLDWAREKWRGSVASKFIRGGEKNAVKYADEIIVLSKGVQKYFMETYGRETHFIPNGVNRPEVREAKLIKDHFGLEKDSYILFLGRLVPEKGIRYLVEAFKNVKTDKKLVIAGGSSDTDSFMEELKELAKGDDRILFTGFVQGAMLDELYSNAYIENVIMMVPFTSMVIWTFQEKMGSSWKKILWYSGKIAFIFSISIEVLQLFLRLGTWYWSVQPEEGAVNGPQV